MVYLLHFQRPYKHARHYVGYTDDLDRRLARHRAGNGARLIEVITQAGIGWTLARTWPEGDRDLERAIKRAGHTPRSHAQALPDLQSRRCVVAARGQVTFLCRAGWERGRGEREGDQRGPPDTET